MKTQRGSIVIWVFVIPVIILLFCYMIPEWYNSTSTHYRPTPEDIAQIQSEPETLSFATWKFNKVYPGPADDDHAKQYEEEKADEAAKLKADPELWMSKWLNSTHDSVVADYWVEQWSKRNPPITIGVADVYQIRNDPAKWLKKFDSSGDTRLTVFLFFTVGAIMLFPLGIVLTIIAKLKGAA
jgi:hypothetical protein